MKLINTWILTLVVAGSSIISFAGSIYPLSSQQQRIQFQRLLHELRCLVCQNQDLADSNADLAKDLRAQVYQLVKANKNDNEIIQYLTERYGDFILFKPPITVMTGFLWFGPAVFLLLGLLVFWATCCQQKKS
ncbi:MAG: cytochrome c-type biogenesis protein [Legionella sp.]